MNACGTVVIKAGNLFAFSKRDGQIPVQGKHPLALYYNDCRYLSVYELVSDIKHEALLHDMFCDAILLAVRPQGPKEGVRTDTARARLPR